MRQVTMTLNGVTKTLDVWATTIGVSKPTLAYRKSRGWTDDQILGLAPSRQQSKGSKAREVVQGITDAREARNITYLGVTGSVSAVCRHHGVPDSQVRSRMKLGWSIEDAFTQPRGYTPPSLKKPKIPENQISKSPRSTSTTTH